MRIGTVRFLWLILIICTVILSGSTVSVLSADNRSADAIQQNLDSPLGANLNVLADWSSEYSFVDAFKQSRPWMTQATGAWDTKEQAQLDLDQDGWPRSLPSFNDWTVRYRWVTTLMFNGISGRYPSGQYIVLYDGMGTLEYGLDATKVSSSAGRDLIRVDAGKTSAGFSLSITETDPLGTGDYIRNVRVIMPGFNESDHASQTFHPTFLNNISKYKVLRFMDWMRTNWDYNENGPIRSADMPELEWTHPLHDAVDNPYLRQATASATRSAELIDWADRPKPSDSTFASEEGVPVETMIALANEVGADPWFNMPHLASDDYITEFARTVFGSLDPTRRVYVEYSNEVWNSGFGQAQWVERTAAAEWPDATVSNFEKRLNWFGQRSAETCNIWKSVYGAASDRVVCVIASQASNKWVGEKMLDCSLSTLAPCHQHVDAIAIAPYFGQHIGDPINLTGVTEWTGRWDGGLTRLFNELEYGSQLVDGAISKTNLPQAKTYINDYATVASTRDLSLVAYEGGQHLAGVGNVSSQDQITALFSSANRDERMTELYDDYLTHWDNAGGEIFVIFNSSGVYSRWGNWGAHEYADEVDTVKHNAITTYIVENPCDWTNCDPAAGSVPTAVNVAEIETVDPTTRIALLLAVLWVITFTLVHRSRPAKATISRHTHDY